MVKIVSTRQNDCISGCCVFEHPLGAAGLLKKLAFSAGSLVSHAAFFQTKFLPKSAGNSLTPTSNRLCVHRFKRFKQNCANNRPTDAARRLRLITAAVRYAWIATLLSPRRTARRKPCWVLASPCIPSVRQRWRLYVSTYFWSGWRWRLLALSSAS